MDANFVAIIPQFLHMSVIGVFVGQKECCGNGTAIWIGTIRGEQSLIYFPIFIINRIVKGDNHHLRRFFWFQITWNQCTIH